MMKNNNSWRCFYTIGLGLLIVNLLTSCEDVSRSFYHNFVYKNESSYNIKYYVKDLYEIGKDSLLFELSPQSEFEIYVGGGGGVKDGGSIEDCCRGALYNVQGFGSTKLEYLEGDVEKCVTYKYGVGPGNELDFDIVKNGSNDFELTYTFTDSIFEVGTVCE